MVDLPNLRFPRCVIPQRFSDGTVQLQFFCDASEKGYGVSCYIRTISQQGEVYVTLLTSKARLAPITQCTIPRLELMAAVEGVRLDGVIVRELDVTRSCDLASVFWTESRIVLSYIMSESLRFQVFVGNRVSFIREYTSPEQWRHTEGKLNPAYILSRGCMWDSLPDVWAEVPAFLRDYKSTWPPWESTEVPNDDPEIKRTVTSSAPGEEQGHPLEKMMKYFSSLYQLKKAVRLRRIQAYRRGKKSKLDGSVMVAEMETAKDELVKFVQTRAYEAEIQTLQQGKGVAHSSSIRLLSPALQNGVLVVEREIETCHSWWPGQEPSDSTNWPQVHSTSNLGTELTSSLVSRKFWIPKCRNLIKQFRSGCTVYK